jgi:RNA polymerase sigma-70 factor (ECF subfamily)
MPRSVVDMAEVGKLFEAHRPRLRLMLQRRIDPALAARIDPDGILEETNWLARQKWEAFQKQEGLSAYAWLYRLARDCLIEAWRREARACRDYRLTMPLPEGTSIQLGLGLVSPGTDPLAALVREEVRDKVRQVMALLRDKDREILWMKHGEGLSYEEIAAVLDIERNAAHVRYHRALGRLSDLWLQLHPESGADR